MGKLIVSAIALLIIIGSIGALFNAPKKTGSIEPKAAVAASKPAAKVAAASDKPRGDPACVERWLAAEKAKIVLGEGFVDGRPTVMVDEDTYRSIDYATKVGMAQTFQCAVVSPGESLAVVYFVSNMTGKPLAIWRMNRLEVQ